MSTWPRLLKAVGEIRLQGDGLRDQINRFIGMTQLVDHHPQQVQGIDVSRIQPQDSAVMFLSFVQTPGLMLGKRRLKALLNGWRN